MKGISVIVVEAADDAERKRMEYVLEKGWRNASRLKGIVRLCILSLLTQNALCDFIKSIALGATPHPLSRLP